MPEDDVAQLALVPQDEAWLKAKCIFVSMMRNSDYFKTVIESSAKSCYLFQLFEKQLSFRTTVTLITIIIFMVPHDPSLSQSLSQS